MCVPVLAACAALVPAMTVRADQTGFEQKISAFFTEDMTDDEALAAAQSMADDADAVGAVAGADVQAKAAQALEAYTSAKTAYFSTGNADGQSDAVAAEWAAQKAYGAEGLPDGAAVLSIVPRWCVSSCAQNADGSLTLGVEEWVVISYSDDGSAASTSAYMYSYSAVLSPSGDGYAVTSADGSSFRAQETAGDEQTAAAAASAGNDGLVGAAQFSYSPAAVTAYADQWAMSRNSAYVFHEGVDCANFVSQSMAAGGLPQTSTWRPESLAWVQCQVQIAYLGSTYSQAVAASASNVKQGNPVYYDWQGDGHYDHAAICVGTDAAGNPIVDAHTNARYHVSYNMGAAITKTVDIAGASGSSSNGGNSSNSNNNSASSGSNSSNSGNNSSSSGGSSQTVLNGVDYSPVYNFSYYVSTYPDLEQLYGSDPAGALRHFVQYGMKEGRQGSSSFDVNVYKENYADLRAAFGSDLTKYYMHYIQYGKNEGRNAATKISSGSSVSGNSQAVLNGVDYSAVYDFNYYINKYPDIKAAYGNNPAGALQHFVQYGMNEGRQGSASFYVWYYRGNYADLIMAYGDDLKPYYIHYVNFGQKEGRVATRKIASNVMIYDGVDYANVYDFCYYTKRYPDIMAAYGSDPAGALQHFLNYGMKEGRQAESSFNVNTYRSRYADLQAAFGNDLTLYFRHYLQYGKSEGRSGI